MKKLFIGLLIGLFISIGNSSAEAGKTWINVSNVIAGNSNNVRISGLYDNENIKIKLIRPDKSKIDLQSYANNIGISSFNLSPIHLQQAGKYELIISRDLEIYPTITTFKVYPAPVSAYRSEIIIDKPSIEADGEEVARIKVVAKDAYNNRIKNTSIKVISSRNSDFIVGNKKTNKNGEIIAKISSKEAGIATISVIADETVLFKKSEIVFYLANKKLKNVGASGGIWNKWGEKAQASIFEDPEEATAVAYFSIEDLPSETNVGETLNAKITAKDKDGNQVVNYTGTVRFSSSDDRASLPNDYTFTLSDQGEHSFFLAVTFGTGGEQTIAVHDLDDFRVSGEQSLNVAIDAPPITIDDPYLTIDIPTSGSTFNTSRVTISGNAPQNHVLKLVDGPTILIDNLTVDESGKYIYQTPALADGTHVFQAISMDDETLISNTVSINIDRTPPQVFSVETVPSAPFKPGETIKINVKGDDLDKVSCVFNEQMFDLSKTPDGTFYTDLTVPNKEGDFPLELTVSDLLGNSVTESNAAIIPVSNKQLEMRINPTFSPAGPFSPGQEITISLEPRDDIKSINLDINDKTIDLENKNGKFEITFTVPESTGDFPLSFNIIDINENPVKKEDIITLSVVDNINPTSPTNLSAKSGEKEKVTLFWSPASDDNSVAKYKVNFAKKGSDILDGENITPDNRTQWYVDGLEAGETYIFQVIALDENGLESPASNIAEGTTFSATTHSAPKKTPKSGNNSSIAIFIAILSGLIMIFFSRRKYN